MQERFYPDEFSKAGIALVIPEQEEQTYIHDKYMNELVNGIILPETRERVLNIVKRMIEQQGIQGLILGGTDFSPIFKDVQHVGIPFLDTTQIHVKRAVAELLS